MKSFTERPQWIVRYYRPSISNPLSAHIFKWDGVQPLRLGHPTRFILQAVGSSIWVRDFTTTPEDPHPTKLKRALVELNVSGSFLGSRQKLSDSSADEVTLDRLPLIPAPNLALAQSLKHNFGNSQKATSLDDQLFYRTLKKSFFAASCIAGLLFLLSPTEDPAKKAEIVPEKYAHIILNRPKNSHSSSPAEAVGASNPTKATFMRAMQSKTVQNSLRKLMKTSLKTYATMTSGRTLQSLSAANPLFSKSNSVISQLNSGPSTLGGKEGYGIGLGNGIQGQGLGQLTVGVNATDASVDEGLTKDEVAKVIHAHLSEIRYCYESAILKDSTLAGKVSIDFKVGGKGDVNSSLVSGTTVKDPQVGNCLANKLKAWKFPQPRGGVTVAVSYPFIFKSLSR